MTMAIAEIPNIEKAALSRKVKRVLGLELHSWEQLMLLSLGIAGLIAVAVFVTTASVVILQRRETTEAKKELDEYKLSVESKVADAKKEGIAAGKAAGNAILRSAELEKQTAELTAKNLALQNLMQPRRLPPPIFLSATIPTTPPPGAEMYKLFSQFKGTPFFIQSVPDFEAQNLANDILFALTSSGWEAQAIPEARVPPNLISDGIMVTFPFLPSAQDSNIRSAAGALADGLSGVGLKGRGGLTDAILSGGYRLKSDGTSIMKSYPSFDPPRDIVVILVGMKPIPPTAFVLPQ